MSEADELQAVFIEEADELLARLDRQLISLETSGAGVQGAGTLRELFRLAHTLKGSASTVGRTDFADVAHALESVLDAVRRGVLSPDRRVVDASLAAVDALKAGLRRPLDPAQVAAALEALHRARQVPSEAKAEPAPVPAPAPERAPVTRVSRRRRRADRPRGFQELVGDLGTRLGELAGGSAPADAVATLVEFVERLAQSAPAQRPLTERLLQAVRGCFDFHRASGELPRGAIDAAFMAADLMLADQQDAVSGEEVAAIEKLLRAASAPPVAPVVHEPSAEDALASVEDGNVRMPVSLLDSILYRLDELVAVKLRADYQRRQMEEAQEALDLALAQTRSNPAEILPHVESHRRRLEVIGRDLNQDVHYLGLVAQGLQEDVKQVRMVPVGPTLDPLRRMVRELAHRLGKEAALEVVGERVRVDKRLLDVIRDPLMHILRNAVDHGIEPPAERHEAGKPERGALRISAEARESQVWIEIQDDGRGISVDTVREVAIARGLMERSQPHSDREVLNLIFAPGFSTVANPSEVSGRGVGLDVVSENVARLGGRIEFFTQEGKGSQFRLILPLTLAASHGLLVEAGKQTYCVPLAAVEEVIAIEPGTIGMAQGRWVMSWRQQAVTCVALDDLLAGRAGGEPAAGAPAVLMAISDRRLALAVDHLLGQEEVVVKGVAPGTPKLPFVSGATSLGDGRLVTVLDPGALVAAAAQVIAQAPAGDSRRPSTILVVDDSLTSRTMVASVLERAGYRTLLAHDGATALALLQREAVDLVVSDVEMPNLDGLSLTRRIRETAHLAQLPVILLTSLDAPEDRARGAEAGATGFILKKRFDPSEFLGMVADFAPRSAAS